MKILYGIQGTGNGHLSRAKEIIPYLKNHGEVDLLVSGIQSELQLPFEIKYRFKGMSFVFGKKGGIDLLDTYMKNHIHSFISEIKSIPINEYDLVISDFEPISSWAAYFKKKTCIALSNQCAVLSDAIPRPKKEDLLGKFILNHYAPSTAEYGFHFAPYAPNIFTPIIREEVRRLEPENFGHYTVYLPSYDNNRIVKKLSHFKDIKWQVFTKHSKIEETIDNVHIRPINSEQFLESMRTSEGVLTAAGFGTTSEALYLGKKLMVIPQKQQYEQQCNAVSLKEMGVPVIKHLRKKQFPKIEKWLKSNQVVEVNYPNQTELIVDTIINNEYHQKDNYLDYLINNQFDIVD